MNFLEVERFAFDPLCLWPFVSDAVDVDDDDVETLRFFGDEGTSFMRMSFVVNTSVFLFFDPEVSMGGGRPVTGCRFSLSAAEDTSTRRRVVTALVLALASALVWGKEDGLSL